MRDLRAKTTAIKMGEPAKKHAARPSRKTSYCFQIGADKAGMHVETRSYMLARGLPRSEAFRRVAKLERLATPHAVVSARGFHYDPQTGKAMIA